MTSVERNIYLVVHLVSKWVVMMVVYSVEMRVV
jgi:hypothetical protein